MAAKKMKLTNTLRQSLNVYLKDGRGVMRTWTIPPKSFRLIHPSEMSQDITDKEQKGYLKVSEVEA